LSRRNMRFRQAQRRRGAALGATPPPLAVASCHRVRPQNRRAVVLAVRFCSFYFAAVPPWCHWPPWVVAVSAMARIAALSGALSEGQAATTAARSGSSGFPICARICV